MSEPGDWSCSPFMADALHANNLTAFRRADGHYLHADRWLQDHVVHAMDACPDVIEYWVINAPPMGRAQRLYRYTAQALEHLSEEDKTELLEGKSTIAARRNLYKYLKDPVQGEHWMSLSPLWVGKSGSALREAAMALRWNPNDMPRMLVEGMQIPGWERWLAHVPYAYSIVAAHWVMLQRISEQVRLPVPRKEMPMLVCSDHANVTDVIVALEMLRLHGGACSVNMRAPLSWKAPHPEDVQRLHALVRLHWDLGMQDAFVDALRDGQLLGWGIEADAPLALPSAFEMGDDPMELPELDVGGSP